jgi:hypothetical protein
VVGRHRIAQHHQQRAPPIGAIGFGSGVMSTKNGGSWM